MYVSDGILQYVNITHMDCYREQQCDILPLGSDHASLAKDSKIVIYPWGFSLKDI